LLASTATSMPAAAAADCLHNAMDHYAVAAGFLQQNLRASGATAYCEVGQPCRAMLVNELSCFLQAWAAEI
jgi:hypothetical protein